MIDQNKRDRPKPYIDRALDLLFKNKKNADYDIDILEIGCMRVNLNHHPDIITYGCCNDGHSSYLFARTGWNVISVDINPNSITMARETCCNFSNTEFIVCDGIEYATQRIAHPIKIGLLFLDAWDFGEPDSMENHLKFYQIIKPFLNEDCLILIDDTDLLYDDEKKEYFPDEECLSGKGKLLIPELVKNGYEIVFKGRQTLLRKT